MFPKYAQIPNVFGAFKTERTANGCNQFNVDASFSGTFLSKALLYHDHSGGPGEKQMFGWTGRDP